MANIDEVKAWLELKYHKHVVKNRIFYCNSNERFEYDFQYRNHQTCKWEICIAPSHILQPCYILYYRNFRKTPCKQYNSSRKHQYKNGGCYYEAITEKQMYDLIWEQEMKDDN